MCSTGEESVKKKRKGAATTNQPCVEILLAHAVEGTWVERGDWGDCGRALKEEKKHFDVY